MASNMLPVHITALSNADAVYEKHAGQELLKVREGASPSFLVADRQAVPTGEVPLLGHN